MNERSITSRFFWWCKYILSSYLRSTPSRLNQKLISWKCLIKFWNIPNAIDSFNTAYQYWNAEREQLQEQLDQVKAVVENLIEDHADSKADLNAKDQDEDEKRCYREVYLKHYIAECFDEDGRPIFRMPSKYQTMKEREDEFDMDYEHHRDAMCGCYDSYRTLIEYEMRDVEKAGLLYDKK